jgi:hypothetical protein
MSAAASPSKVAPSEAFVLPGAGPAAVIAAKMFDHTFGARARSTSRPRRSSTSPPPKPLHRTDTADGAHPSDRREKYLNELTAPVVSLSEHFHEIGGCDVDVRAKQTHRKQSQHWPDTHPTAQGRDPEAAPQPQCHRGHAPRPSWLALGEHHDQALPWRSAGTRGRRSNA